MLQTPTRERLERAAHEWDEEAYAELLRYDARHGGHTARWQVRRECFGWQIVVDGWFFQNARATKREAREAYEKALESGELTRQLGNWASMLFSKELPCWWGQDHHLKGRLPVKAPQRPQNRV